MRALLVASVGASGVAYSTFEAINETGAPCRTEGYIGVGILKDDGSLVSAPPTSRDPSIGSGGGQPPQPVALASGAAGLFTLAWADYNMSDNAPCPSYRQLRITPPDDTSTLAAEIPAGFDPSVIEWCGDSIRVSPVAAEPPRCTTSILGFGPVQVTNLVQSAGQPASGFGYVSVTNTATVACHVFGWPGLALLGASGTSLPIDVQRVSGPAELAIIPPGEFTSPALSWSVNCASPLRVVGLQVIPPGDSSCVRVPAQPALTSPPIAVCGGSVQLFPMH